MGRQGPGLAAVGRRELRRRVVARDLGADERRQCPHRQERDANSDANSNTDTNTDTDTHADTNADTDTDSDAHAHADACSRRPEQSDS